jgi:hypothetical protein
LNRLPVTAPHAQLYGRLVHHQLEALALIPLRTLVGALEASLVAEVPERVAVFVLK